MLGDSKGGLFDSVPDEYRYKPLIEYVDHKTDDLMQLLIDHIVCRRHLYLFPGYDQLNLTENTIHFMKRSPMKSWFEMQTSSWNGKFSPEFSEIFTLRGLAFSFNML